ncbi:hypothetical protein GCM10017687_27670 [Streptomyces echinatus]
MRPHAAERRLQVLVDNARGSPPTPLINAVDKTQLVLTPTADTPPP